MGKKFHSRIIFWMMTAMITAGLSHTDGAAEVEHPEDIYKVYEFKGKSMKGYGADLNADFSRLDQLFWTTPVINAQPEAEPKGYLGISMKLPSRPPKDPDTGKALSAIEVIGIMPYSAADAAGLHKGDLIVGLDGVPIEDKGDKTLLTIREAVSRKHLGEKLKLRILRGESFLEPEATIKPYPRVKPVLKPHPELEKFLHGNETSLLSDALEKEELTDEFAGLIREFRNETDKVVSPLLRQDNFNPFRLQEVNYVMYNPLALPALARKATDRLHGSFDKTHHDLAALLRTAMDELDMTYTPAENGGNKLPTDLTGYVEQLLKAIQHANAERSAVLSVLDAEDIDFLYSTAPKLLEGESDSAKKDETEEEKEKADAIKQEEEARLLRFYRLVLKLDIPRLLNAAAEVARALDLETLAALDKKAGELGRYPKGWVVRKEKNLTVIDTPSGRVLIGGAKDNIYTEDAALILDFGGNDKYLNHAGGSSRLNPFSVVIDLTGDDVYSAANDFSQGAGLLGGGFLVDLEGNDRYMAKSFSQGTGVLGIGILADLAGRDQYNAIVVSQGAGSFGIGMVAEGGGDDTYYGNYFVQGAGDTKGFGVIVETAGNDNYFAGSLYDDLRAIGKSYKSMSQGFGYGVRPWESFIGASGGIGIIAEAEGNDTYVADYFAQGSSYWLALGILDDRKGNDRYISGRYSQGAGIHVSAGVLIDGEGDDVYLADFGVAQGCGHDYGIGFLLDNSGNDRYIAGVIAQGAGNADGIGVLSDNGGNDEYQLNNLGQGRGNFEYEGDTGSFGFLFDTGGEADKYSQGAKNNSLNYKTRRGILLDSN